MCDEGERVRGDLAAALRSTQSTLHREDIIEREAAALDQDGD
jgi:hypothetical protein